MKNLFLLLILAVMFVSFMGVVTVLAEESAPARDSRAIDRGVITRDTRTEDDRGEGEDTEEETAEDDRREGSSFFDVYYNHGEGIIQITFDPETVDPGAEITVSVDGHTIVTGGQSSSDNNDSQDGQDGADGADGADNTNDDDEDTDDSDNDDEGDTNTSEREEARPNRDLSDRPQR